MILTPEAAKNFVTGKGGYGQNFGVRENRGLSKVRAKLSKVSSGTEVLTYLELQDAVVELVKNG